MINFPNCKINLGMRILQKRSDGFHNVETLLYPVGIHDILEIIEADDGTFRFQTSGLDISGDRKHNLVIKAYELMKSEFKLPPVHIYLHKVIPMGAGLGGGSSDAAYAIKMINDLFGLQLDDKILEGYARQLGSDCAFFIKNEPALATGKGDELSAVQMSLTDFYLVIVKPEIHISTPDAYSWITPNPKGPSLLNVAKGPITQWKNELHNDFEQMVFKHHPPIAQIKKDLYHEGAVFASLTGSGAAVYGLFKKDSAYSIDFANCFVWDERNSIAKVFR